MRLRSGPRGAAPKTPAATCSLSTARRSPPCPDRTTDADDEVIARFFGAAFTAAAQSDRQGLRLEGAEVAPRAGEILTCGVVAGAVQVPRGGQPIVLLADHQTTGGYPIIATVIGADLGLVAQRAPGEPLRFYRVDRERALLRGRERTALLASA